MAKTDKTALSRKYLKIIGTVIIALSFVNVAYAILSMTGAVPEAAIRQSLSASVELDKFSFETVRTVYGIGILVASFLSFVTGCIIRHAAKPDKGTTIALVLCVLNAVTGLLALVGDAEIPSQISGIINVTVYVLAILAIYNVRKDNGELKNGY